MDVFLPFLIFGTMIILLVSLLSMIWPPDSPWSPWWRTSAIVARVMCKKAKITKKDILYDLGCGDGTVLLTAAKEYQAHGVGVDIDPLRVWVATCRMILHRVSDRVRVKRGNLFKTNISRASVVIVYLVPKTLNRLEEKFRKELRPGTRVVSYVYQIEYLPKIAEDRAHKVYVYEIPRA